MRLNIDHRTRYSFSEPQNRVVQLLRMTPQDFGAQTVIDWTISVNCDARMREGRDGYGNITTMLYVDGPIDAVEIIVRGEVLTDDRGGLVVGVPETLPEIFYLRDTPLTQADGAIVALAHALVRTAAKAELPNCLVTDIFSRIAHQSGRTPKSRTAAQTLAQGSGGVRDKAHLLLSVARAAGLPARLISGHCLDGLAAVGHKSAHCWVEIFVEGTGWVGFDASTGLPVGESYVRVAIGLDASDATPLSGTRRGGGIEELDVDVRVALSQPAEQ